MKKILPVINPHQVDAYPTDFAFYLAKLTHSRLTAIFVEDAELKFIPSINTSNSSIREESDVIEKNVTKSSIKVFKDTCANDGVDVTIYGELDDVMDKITYESRFADLLILDPKTSFNKKTEAIPTHFVREILANAECPVIIAPDVFSGVEEVVFCYDGSASSVFAIKQFTYLFPEYNEKNATILHINTPKQGVSDNMNKKIYDWLKPHYASVNFHLLKGEISDELFTCFLNKEKVFIVMGAYGRSMLSNFFKKSSADLVMRVVDFPLFISHH